MRDSDVLVMLLADMRKQPTRNHPALLLGVLVSFQPITTTLGVDSANPAGVATPPVTITDQEVTRSGVAPFNSAHLQNTAWEIIGSWVLTGEDAAYAGGVIPDRPFNPAAGGWGGWQLVARYAQLDIDHEAFPDFANPEIAAGSASAWSVGLNWYLNRNVRVNASFSHTHFNGGGGAGTSAPATVTRRDENVMFTRVQLAF
jgi:phosphate-selective porin OprO and OprP